MLLNKHFGKRINYGIKSNSPLAKLERTALLDAFVTKANLTTFVSEQKVFYQQRHILNYLFSELRRNNDKTLHGVNLKTTIHGI